MVADGLSVINADFSNTSFRLSQVSHRGPQLPRQLHRLSRPEPCRRELPARHEGPDSRSTGRSATASGCSARPASRSRAPSPGTAGSARVTRRGAAAQAPLQEQVQPAHHGPGPAGAVAPRLRTDAVGHVRGGLLPHGRPGGRRRRTRAWPPCSPPPTSCWSNALPPGSADSDHASARSTTATSGGTSDTGSSSFRRSTGCSPEPRSRIVVSRLLGVRLGRRVFDDGAAMTERTLVTIGDDSTLNAGVVIQCHSQEDGHFKSEHITIGAGCTLGVGAFVHYGVNMGDGAVLGAGSFLMKGEEVPARCAVGRQSGQELRARHPAAHSIRRRGATPGPSAARRGRPGRPGAAARRRRRRVGSACRRHLGAYEPVDPAAGDLGGTGTGSRPTRGRRTRGAVGVGRGRRLRRRRSGTGRRHR